MSYFGVSGGPDVHGYPGGGLCPHPDEPDIDDIAEQLMAPGAPCDPFDGDNIAEALGELTEGQLIDAGDALRSGDDREFCRVVRGMVQAHCLRRAYLHASQCASRSR